MVRGCGAGTWRGVGTKELVGIYFTFRELRVGTVLVGGPSNLFGWSATAQNGLV